MMKHIHFFWRPIWFCLIWPYAVWLSLFRLTMQITHLEPELRGQSYGRWSFQVGPYLVQFYRMAT